MNIDEAEFPERKQLSSRRQTMESMIKNIDMETADFSDVKRHTKSEVIQKQATYAYIRVFLREEDHQLVPNDVVKIIYTPTGEVLDTLFISYGKDREHKNNGDDIVGYVPEDNRKEICLMINVDIINIGSEHIQFIRSLFRCGRFFEYQLLRHDELEVSVGGVNFDYFDIDFG